jgi:hypothetical protein
LLELRAWRELIVQSGISHQRMAAQPSRPAGATNRPQTLPKLSR